MLPAGIGGCAGALPLARLAPPPPQAPLDRTPHAPPPPPRYAPQTVTGQTVYVDNGLSIMGLAMDSKTLAEREAALA